MPRLRRPSVRSSVLGSVAASCALGVHAGPLEEIVVTASRRPEPAFETPASLSRLAGDSLSLVGSTHHSELLNRTPGTLIQRGSGQESLTAIRSPVLTGAGSCGAFLFLENGIPIRPVGFCNVNELFEVNTEQALAVEVFRGPGTSLYGSGALHGMVNVLQPSPAERPVTTISLEGGAAGYVRAKLAARIDEAELDTGLAALYTHDDGWRDASGYDEAKLNVVLGHAAGDSPWRVDVAATLLEQETAGFIVGENAYRDEELSRSNPNPEAFRDARSLRVTGLVAVPVDGGLELELRPYLRASRMEFLQHFLLGQPLERNGQESLGLLTALRLENAAGWSLAGGADLELANVFLVEEQQGPTTGGSPAANAIRPAGKHYDYEVRSGVAALHGTATRRLGDRWRVEAGLRLEHVDYRYDNRMLDGNTDENGVPCPFGGCLYSRPADRSDAFTQFAPRVAVTFAPAETLRVYASWSQGFRPPEMTELYRLQRRQTDPDLDAERVDAVELGLKAVLGHAGFALAAYDSRKDDVILREANGFYVGDGRTSHRGIEYELDVAVAPTLSIAAAGTWARHRYEFSRAVEGGEAIVDGNDVDTAPRQLHTLRVDWAPTAGLSAETEWLAVGEYWADAANEHRYAGHGLLNVRARWLPRPGWSLVARLTNLLDRRYADRADYAFGSDRYFPGRGRALFVEVGWLKP